jgi:Tfp pilus assembly protein PilN
MIEVNLLPGGKKGSGGRRKFAFALPKFRSGGGGVSISKRDPWTLGAAAAVIVAIFAASWLFMGVSGVAEELTVQIESARSDSTRFAGIIQRSSTLQARRDTIAERVGVIQEIDQRRYLWPHIMDEVARALPDYTWLTRLAQNVEGERVSFQIQGMAGTYFAMTAFMENLEASPFIEGVSLVSSAQIPVGSNRDSGQLVYGFTFDAMESIPPSEILETVPLFDPFVVDPNSFGVQGSSIGGVR